jgi:hypothetical protein
VVGIAVGALLILAVITGLVGIFSRRLRRRSLRIAGLTVTSLVALYAVGRGVAEFWTVNYSDPASYAHSWGGPSLAGVFAVHSGPGFAVVTAVAWWLVRRVRHSVSRGSRVPGGKPVAATRQRPYRARRC